MSYPRSQLARAFKRISYTGGNITLNQTAITDVHASALDIVLQAEVGDQIEYGVSMRCAPGVNVTTAFDVYSIVSSARVNALAGPGLSASLASLQGVSHWRHLPTVEGMTGGAVLGPALQSGDLASGYVTLRLAYAQTGSTSRTLYADTNTPIIVWAQNRGPCDPS